MDPQLKARLKKGIPLKWYKCTGTSGNLDKTYADPVEVPCLSWNGFELNINSEGFDIKSNENLLIDYVTYQISNEDEVEYMGQRYPVQAVKPVQDPQHYSQWSAVVII